MSSEPGAGQLGIPNHDWSEWELDFLEAMSRFEGPNVLSQRQREKLFELRDAAEYISTIRTFSVKRLIEGCWLARSDLDSDEDTAFIEKLRHSGVTAIQRRSAGRLFRCSQELQLVEEYA